VPRPFSGWHNLVADLEQLRTEPDHRGADPQLARLSEREQLVLAHLAAGMADAAIAEALSLSLKTVQSHVWKLMRKLDLPRGPRHNRRVLAALAYLEHERAGPAPPSQEKSAA
jgi:DNA-binding NarL/FixJ family response regulator